MPVVESFSDHVRCTSRRVGAGLAASLIAVACGPAYVTPAPLPAIGQVVTTSLPPGQEATDNEGNPLSIARACDGGDAAACAKLCERQVNPSGFVGMPELRPESAARGAKWCTRACERNSDSACGMLGALHLYGFGVPRDPDRARSLFISACDRGVLPACENLGVIYLGDDNHHAAPADAARAVALLSRVCDAGILHGCANLANAYALGLGVPKDGAKAVALAGRACDGDIAQGCIILGGYNRWGEHGLLRDASKAFALITRACSMGSPRGCGYLADYYANGIGVPKNDTRAFEIYKKSCDDGFDRACHGVGVFYAEGRFVLTDYARAADYYRSACDRGVGESCANLGVLFENGQGVPEDLTRAVALFEQACTLGNVIGCVNLGNMYVRGAGTPRDFDKAEIQFRRGCDLGEFGGCRNEVLVTEYQRQGGVDDPPGTATKIEMRCRGGRGAACHALGLLTETGAPGVVKDGTRALELYRKGCKAKEPSPLACKEAHRLEKTR